MASEDFATPELFRLSDIRTFNHGHGCRTGISFVFLAETGQQVAQSHVFGVACPISLTGAS
jgi:hypothetical protein